MTDIYRVLAETPSRAMSVDPAEVIRRARRRRLRQRVTVGAASLATAAVVAGLTISNPFASHSMTLPASRLLPKSATVTEATTWYLQKAKEQDCAATRAVTLPHTWAWCSNPRLRDFKALGGPVSVPASIAGRDEQCVNFQMFTTGDSEGTIPAGWRPWSLCFVKTQNGLRLYDQGTG
jgi:hypothetical protein